MGQQNRKITTLSDAGASEPVPGVVSDELLQTDDPEASASLAESTSETQVSPWPTYLFLSVAACFSLYLLRYYLFGIGGPTLLAVTLIPVAFILFTLDSLRKNDFYPKFGLKINYAIAAVYIALCVVIIVYMRLEFFDIRTVRAGLWSAADLVMGGLMFAMVMEFARKKYFALFILNLILILYTVYGWLVPGLFGHPGLTWSRVLSAMSVEMTTGVYSRLPQLALTLIGSFLLVLSVLRAFGCVDSLIKGASRIAARSLHALPQAAVIGSFGVAAVSGSGAANAATTGSATIPAMIASGLPRPSAAAIETASSLGGQLMPPIMGISAFLMADFLGRSYFDVVARGYAPALIYFAGVSVSVFLISIRYKDKLVSVSLAETELYFIDGIKIFAYGAVVVGLVVLMALAGTPPMIAAVRIFVIILIAMCLMLIITNWRSHGSPGFRTLAVPLRRLVTTFTGMTTELALLLAVLSIMTGAFVITGVPPKIGFLLMEAAGVNLVTMILVGFLFGAVVGTGLPPAPTYIITALVIAPPMIKTGVNPWVVHFFAFFLAVWGELTPPTSVVAAVASRIADASFMRTLFRAIRLCIGLFVLMGAIFAKPQLVLEPGFAQLAAFGLVLAGTIGIAFSLQANFSLNRPLDLFIRIVLAGLSILIVLYPELQGSLLGVFPVAGLLTYWFIKQRRKAPVRFENQKP
ncbi:MAG: TRAP transporter permease [Deltaproteobacteria bacterium]|nr:TRAP transporter permease [Deltaproteobacteria bacterium]